MAEVQKRSVCSGINFRSIRDSRFKTARISINFLLPLKKETAAKNALLPFLLTRSCKKYPDFTKLNEHLAELYGAELDADIQKLGDVQMLSIFVSGLADRYALHDEKMSEELSRLLCDVVFEPQMPGGLFPEDGFEQEKRQLMETLDSEFNDKQIYAFRRCQEIMCSKEPYGLSRLGTKEEIKNLKRSDLTAAWERMLQSAPAEIMVLGNCDPEPVFHSFSDAFAKHGRANIENYKGCVVRKAGEPKDIAEKMDVVQSKLVMGFRTGCVEPEKAVPAVKLMSAMYGGSPNSKLFLNVREKMSLCYYCSSSFNPIKGIMFVQSGVEQKNIERAKDEIIAQLDDMKHGKFTDEEIDEAKLSLCNLYHTVSDSLEALEGWYLSKTFSNPLCTPEHEAEMINGVTRSQITEAAQQVELDTVYRLTGNGGNSDE